jgi:hypothetical protein
MSFNTDYPMRLPSMDEIRARFGSLQDCVRCTRADLPTILYYIANSEIPLRDACHGRADADTQWSRELRDRAKQEWLANRDRTIIDTYLSLGTKKSVQAVMNALHHSRDTVTRALTSAGIDP